MSVEVLSFASCYCICGKAKRGSELSLLQWVKRKNFLTALPLLETVTTSDLRHKWVAVYGVKKLLVF